MKLIVTRHGETEENKKGILMGHTPGKLSNLGKEQAKKVALRLKDEKIDYIYSSDLARAVDTAKEIKKFHQNSILVLTENLRECDLGIHTGKSYNSLDWNTRPKECEDRISMKKRVKELLDDVYTKYPNKTVLFVAHDGINKQIFKLIMDQPVDFKIESQSNTAINIFELCEDKNHKIHLMGCTKHLE